MVKDDRLESINFFNLKNHQSDVCWNTSQDVLIGINGKKDEIDLENIGDYLKISNSWSNRPHVKIIHSDFDYVMMDDGLVVKLHAQN